MHVAVNVDIGERWKVTGGRQDDVDKLDANRLSNNLITFAH